jgi:hypothetical protein
MLDAVRSEVKPMLEQTGNLASYFDDYFLANAANIFVDLDADELGWLSGEQLREAVLQILPPEHAEEMREGAGVTEQDRSMFEIVTAFQMLVHDVGSDSRFGVSVELFPDFVRFCLSWRVFAYFNHTKIKKHPAKPKVDVICIGGPWVSRREALVARLLSAYHSVFAVPVSATDREPEPWEVDGLHHRFISPEAFDAKLAMDDFITHCEADCGRYGYELTDLLQPSRERSLVCVSP